MRAEVGFTGLTNAPSDRGCVDGTLEIAHNLVNEHGELRAAPLGTVVREFGKGVRLLHIHKTSEYTHYIIERGPDGNREVAWFAEDAGEDAAQPLDMGESYAAEVRSVTSVGNTLLLLTDEGMCYHLWTMPDTENAAKYVCLGTHLPECPINFGLHSTYHFGSTGANIYARSKNDNDWRSSGGPGVAVFRDSGSVRLVNGRGINDGVYGAINRFVAEQSKEGYFVFPFLLRYAYRLYDDSLVMHSAPIMMIPSTRPPQVFSNPTGGEHFDVDGNNTATLTNVRAGGVASKIDMQFYKSLDESGCPTAEEYNSLIYEMHRRITDWGDIIKSVDIFVSQPFYTHDGESDIEWFDFDSVEVRAGKTADEAFGFSVTRCHEMKTGGKRMEDRHGHVCVADLRRLSLNYDTPYYTFRLPLRSETELKAEVKDCANFYMVASIPISQLDWTKRERRILWEMPDLRNLATLEAMTDDAGSHDTLIPRICYAYNSRLNLADVRKLPFGGFVPQCYFPYTSGYYINDEYTTMGLNGLRPEVNLGGGCEINERGQVFRIYVYIKDGDRRYCVDAGTDYGVASFNSFLHQGGVGKSPYNPFYYFFFPHPGAYKAVIVPTMDNLSMHELRNVYELPLERSDFLNGALYFDGFKCPKYSDITNSTDYPEIQQHLAAVGRVSIPIASERNKIYTSEVDNPFVFPAAKVNTVGAGAIVALASAARPLSQGQFGQFPLYAFTDEGIWALEVSSEGGYTSRQPISREVCTNADAVVQLDTSVMFPTKRGILELAGSNLREVSEVLSERRPARTFDGLPDGWVGPTASEFKGFLESTGLRMIYDYANNRVVLLRNDMDFGYSLSRETGQWTTVDADFGYAVPSYPDALIVDSNGHLLNLGGNERYATEQTLLTRPMKLGQLDVLKTAEALIGRGVFEKGAVQMILYGSNDLLHWAAVGSSASHAIRNLGGTGYKYFRLAMRLRLAAEDSVAGASIEFRPRFAGKMR